MVTWTFTELDDVGSTQAVAKSLAAMGAKEGTVVVAKSQSSGEGRYGRTWFSPVGGLYMSLVLRPAHLSRPELVSLVSAVAVVKGVKSSTGIVSRIRWPNDVMVRGKKLAGVIAEGQSYKGEVTQVVVGVGLNCNMRVADTEGLKGEATSLLEELGRKVEVSEVKHHILEALSDLYDQWQQGTDMVPIWKAHLGTPGKQISIKLKTAETPFASQAVGVELEGGLVIERDGTTRVLHAEEVEWLRERS